MLILPSSLSAQHLKQCTVARDATATVTAQIEKVQREIDARVAALYGL